MIRSAVLLGLDVRAVDVEIGLRTTEPERFVITGLVRREVQESRNRLEHAIPASGFNWPTGSISVNLAPAGFEKPGTSLDLAIALAILEASGQIRSGFNLPIIPYAIGELGLDGQIRGVPGALLIARTIVPVNGVLIAPRENNDELALLRQISGAAKQYYPYDVATLREAVDTLERRTSAIAFTTKDNLTPAVEEGIDFAKVIGQDRAKRALEVAAAGGHNVLLVGPPGEGKSMLAKAFPTILPKLSPTEIVDLTAIYSAAGKLHASNAIVSQRPYRNVHHTTSAEALVGGGRGVPGPGEITLAHRGVLFLDELPEFRRPLIETLRQPLENGYIDLQRVNGSRRFPCEMILVAAMNPCPCSRDGDFKCKRCDRRLTIDQLNCPSCRGERLALCTCTGPQKKAYKGKISGAIMDRIDLKIRVTALNGTS